ncbi:MAG: class I SAM-dependent methyltransferase [Alphaproteobacteria bacterium]|nr:class I SAM-dependent methyltransferase [Alphaproteobacteria bacterium]
MRSLNAYDLKSFYNTSKGRIIRRIINQKIESLWPEINNTTLMGYGYPIPYLSSYKQSAQQLFTGMPTQLGVLDWPHDEKNKTCLFSESSLPFETNSIDYMLMAHALEFLDHPEDSFAEIWRVLKSTGRLIIIVPNRMGFWARADWGPFCQGSPYSARQVESFLTDNLFVHEHTSQALFVPPFESSVFFKTARYFEAVGPYLYPALGGVHVIESSKQIYAGTGRGVKSRSSREKTNQAPVRIKPVPNPKV